MKYYVYIHRDNNGNVFYVGKGSNGRSGSLDRNDDWCEFVKENGNEFSIDIIADDLDEHTALLLESGIIKALTPNLTNRTIISDVIVPEKIKVPTRKANEPKDYSEVNKLKSKLAEIKFSERESSFLNSGKATCSKKQLTDSELRLRKRIASKLKKKKKLQDKIEDMLSM